MNEQVNSDKKQHGVYYGWWILIACSLFNLIVGGSFYYGFTVFFDPLRETFGWSSTQAALGISIQRLVSGIAAPLIGFVFDRTGPRKLLLFGMLIAGIGLMTMSQIRSLTAYYSTFLITSIGISIAWVGVPMYTISKWFVKKRALALALLMAGTGLGGLLVPALVNLIARTSWQTGLMTVGIIFCLISLPLSLIVKHYPEKYGLLPDGENIHTNPVSADRTKDAASFVTETSFSFKEAIKSSAFWLISGSLTISQFAATAVIVFEIPHLENIGVSRQMAGLMVTFTTLLNLAGSLGSGFLGDFVKKKKLLIIALAMQCLGIFILSIFQETWQLIAFLLIYGIGYGATVPLRPALIADYFGSRNIGAILGLLMSLTLFGSIASPIIAGWFFDLNGSYRGIFTIYAVILALAIPAAFLIKKPIKKRS